MRMTASRVYMRPQPLPKMPPGMVELMEGLTRDVLKNNPPDVYEYCANHMQKLLEIRDGPVSKRPMTLEEKIVRAQQKLREKAEQRRRQYDKEVKLQAGNKNGKLKSENSQEIIAQPNIDEIETQIISESVAESSLKAPVHHEHELRDTLEVEIYHESSDNSLLKEEIIEELKNTDNKNINASILDEAKVIEEQNNENRGLEEKPVTTSNDSTVSETDEVSKMDKSSSMGENDIENPVHIRKTRSVEDFTDNVKELEQKNSLIVQTQSAEITTPKLVTERKDGSEGNSHDNFDYTQTVTNESANKSERSYQGHNNQTELKTVTDVSEIEPQKNETQNVIFKEVTCSTIKLAEVDQGENEVKDPENNNTEAVNVDDIKESEGNKNMDVMLSKKIINTTAETTSVEKINDETNVKNTANENVSDDESKPEIKANDKQHDHYENTSSIKVDSGVENYVPSEVEAEFRNETIMESKTVYQYNEDENGTVEFSLNKDVEGGINEKKPCLEPFIDKGPEDTGDFIHTNIGDVVISEHRVLVVELADIKDDNASVPEQNPENVVDNRELRANGRNLTDTLGEDEDTDKHFLSASGADSEKSDTDQLSKDLEQTFNERSKRNLENISEGIETTSNTTDVGKSDNETISLDKFSSMDDSAPEDSNDNSGNEIKTNGKSTNYTHSAMDLETAAVTIQKVFRTFLFKSRASTFEDSVNDDINLTDEDTEQVDIDLLVPPPTNMKERRGIARMDTVLQTVNEEKSLSLSTDDSSLSSAATVIQAHVRGFLVRNKLNSNKTASSASLVTSDGHSTSLEAEVDQNKPNKTVLNIIVPEGGHFVSRDESVLTSMELSLDGSPPSSVNLHPLGYDKSEPRKQLKRGDAIQSISPPSNNSGKLSEDVDSIKETLNNDSTEQQKLVATLVDDIKEDTDANSRDTTPTKSTTVETVVEAHKWTKEISSLDDKMSKTGACRGSLTNMSSDESDVVTPFEEKNLSDSDNTLGLLHSGEFHDVVLPTKLSRSDTSVVRGE